jgi:hypothetical protein
MGAVAGVASALSAIAVLASSPILAPLIKFLKIFKLVSRLKLINIFFGAYLEFILMIAGLMFNIGDDDQVQQVLRVRSPNERKAHQIQGDHSER